MPTRSVSRAPCRSIQARWIHRENRDDRPERYDVLKYDEELGELSVNAEGNKKLVALYRNLFGDAGRFPGAVKFTLEPLRTTGRLRSSRVSTVSRSRKSIFSRAVPRTKSSRPDPGSPLLAEAVDASYASVVPQS